MAGCGGRVAGLPCAAHRALPVPHLPRRRPTARRPTTGSTTACSCSTATVSGGGGACAGPCARSWRPGAALRPPRAGCGAGEGAAGSARGAASVTPACSLCPAGIRTEQDFYVRLIDSMTKQVSPCAGGGARARPGRGVLKARKEQDKLKKKKGKTTKKKNNPEVFNEVPLI